MCVVFKFCLREITFGNITAHPSVFCSLTFIPSNGHGGCAGAYPDIQPCKQASFQYLKPTGGTSLETELKRE